MLVDKQITNFTCTKCSHKKLLTLQRALSQFPRRLRQTDAVRTRALAFAQFVERWKKQKCFQPYSHDTKVFPKTLNVGLRSRHRQFRKNATGFSPQFREVHRKIAITSESDFYHNYYWEFCNPLMYKTCEYKTFR